MSASFLVYVEMRTCRLPCAVWPRGRRRAPRRSIVGCVHDVRRYTWRHRVVDLLTWAGRSHARGVERFFGIDLLLPRWPTRYRVAVCRRAGAASPSWSYGLFCVRGEIIRNGGDIMLLIFFTQAATAYVVDRRRGARWAWPYLTSMSSSSDAARGHAGRRPTLPAGRPSSYPVYILLPFSRALGDITGQSYISMST